jgi:hypothetical protein
VAIGSNDARHPGLAQREAGYSPGVRLAVVLSLFVALLPIAAVASPSRTAHVTLASLSPVSVRGTSFLSDERVAVTVFAKSARTKTVTAGSRGGFRVTFTTVSIGACQAYAVRAKGNRGSVAFLKVTPECAPTGSAGEPDPGLPSDPVPKKR